MDGRRARLIVTDPPYLVGYDGTNHPQSFTGGGSKDWSESYGTGWDDQDGNSDLYEKFIAAAAEHAASEDAAWYVWHASRRQVMLEQAMTKAGLLVHCQIIWTKNKPVLTRTWYMWQHEPCLMGWKKGMMPDKAPEAEPMSTVWNIDTIPNGEERPEHPTPKPLDVYLIPIRQHTRAGDVVFDSFSGSGTCIIAAEQIGRRCCTIEHQPLYVDVAILRWQRMTGHAARLDGDGRSFDEIAQERARCPNVPRARAATRAADSSRKAGSAKRTSKSTSQKPGRAQRPQRTRVGTARRGDA
jgi:DNA modification methylase